MKGVLWEGVYLLVSEILNIKANIEIAMRKRENKNKLRCDSVKTKSLIFSIVYGWVDYGFHNSGLKK